MVEFFEWFQLLIMAVLSTALVAVLVSIVVWLTKHIGMVAFALRERNVQVERQRLDLSLIQPTLNGALPIARRLLDSGQLAPAILQLLHEDIQTRRLPQPALHTYAPHIRYDYDNDVQTQGALPEQSGYHVEPLSAVECFSRGLFADPNRLLTGFEDGSPVYSPVDRTYGVCIAGLPGMGKSNGMRFYTLQMVLHGAQVAIIDPAANSASGEGLAAAFNSHLWAPMAVEPESIVELLRRIDVLGARRGAGQTNDLTPIILLADEVTSMITDEEYGAEIKALLMRINRRYRKDKIYTIGAGQDWLAGAQGGDTSLRNTYVCKTIFRIDKMNAVKLLPNPKLAPLVPELREGQAIFVGHDTVAHVIDVPYCPAASVSMILGQSTQPGSNFHTGKLLEVEANGEQFGSDPEVNREVDGSAEITIDADQMRRIKQLAEQGASTFKIVKTVFRVTGGRGLRSLLDQTNFILGRNA